MSFVNINLNKPTGGGASQSKSSEAILVDLADVQNFPGRDSKGIVLDGTLVFLPGKYGIKVQLTGSKTSLPVTSEGEEDTMSVSAVPEVYHPGDSLEFQEWCAHSLNRNYALFIRIGGCDGQVPYWKVFGSKCNPLTPVIEKQDDNEATTNKITFQQFTKSNLWPGRYSGTITLPTSKAVVADVTVVDVTAGQGEYQLVDNTAATILTDITNATNNGVYTLIGSGGINPAQILADNTKFLLAGAVDWQGLAGARLTVRAYEQATGTFVFVEESRV